MELRSHPLVADAVNAVILRFDRPARLALGPYKLTVATGEKSSVLTGKLVWRLICQMTALETGLVESPQKEGVLALMRDLDARSPERHAWTVTRALARARIKAATHLMPKLEAAR